MQARLDLAPFGEYNEFGRNTTKKTIYRNYNFLKKQIATVKGDIPNDFDIREKHRNIHSDPTFFSPDDDIVIKGKCKLDIFPEYFDKCSTLDDKLRGNLRKLNYEQLTHVQRIIIPLISGPLDIRNDVVLCGRTGSGKTLGYLIAAINNAALSNKTLANNHEDLQHNPSVLIMIHGNYAAEQVYVWAQQLSSNTSVIIGSAIGHFNRTSEFENFERNGADILIATLGRLIDYLTTSPHILKGVKLLVFDDADLFLRDEDWNAGIKNLQSAIDGPCQVVCLSAGLDESCDDAVVKFTHDNRWVIDIASLNKIEKSIPQTFIDFSYKDRTEELMRQLLKRSVNKRYPKAIVFCNAKEIATMVSHRLRLDLKLPYGFRPRVAYLHGGTYDPQSVFNAFCTDKGARTDLEGDDSIEVDVLVACDGFAYGINAKVELVVNFDFPTSLVIYAQRIGRVGRQGVAGEAVTLVNSKTLRNNPKIFEDNVLHILQAADKAKAVIPDSLRTLMHE